MGNFPFDPVQGLYKGSAMEGTESRGLGTPTYTKVPPLTIDLKMRDFWEIFNSPLSVVYLAIFTKYPWDSRVSARLYHCFLAIPKIKFLFEDN